MLLNQTRKCSVVRTSPAPSSGQSAVPVRMRNATLPKFLSKLIQSGNYSPRLRRCQVDSFSSVFPPLSSYFSFYLRRLRQVTNPMGLPNQQRTLNKLLTELRYRNFVDNRRLSIKIGAKRAKTCVHALCIHSD